MLGKGNIAYSIWAKSLKQSFLTFEHSLNRPVLPKTAQGREKVSEVEKGTQSLFSEIPIFQMKQKLLVTFWKNIQHEKSHGLKPLPGISCLRCHPLPLLALLTSNRNYGTRPKMEYTHKNTAFFRG